MAPLRSAVHVLRSDFIDLLLHGKEFSDFPHLAQSAEIMIDDLLWWATTLRADRGRGASIP